MSVQSGESVASYRRDRSLTAADQGCHRGVGALARYREANQRHEKSDDVVIRQVHTSVTLPSASHYPFCQPPFLYPKRPQPQPVGDRKRSQWEKEAAFREARRGVARGGPARRLSPLRASLPQAIEDDKTKGLVESALDTPHGAPSASPCGVAQRPDPPMSMGLTILKAEQAERLRPRTQAEVGSPLDFPDMPKMTVDLSYRTKPSMHARRVYYDASLWNPFRAPRLADEWGGIDFSFRFLQHPERRPRALNVGEREREVGMGGGLGRHDRHRRVGYHALNGPTHATYCPANTATPLVAELHRRLEQLTQPERQAEEDARKWKEVYDRVRSPMGNPSARTAMTAEEALRSLLAHREEAEGGKEWFAPPPLQQEDREPEDGFSRKRFVHTDDVHRMRLRARREEEKAHALQGFPRPSRRVDALPDVFDLKELKPQRTRREGCEAETKVE